MYTEEAKKIRKDSSDVTIERQKREAELEKAKDAHVAKYAKNEVERGAQLTQTALDKSSMAANIEVSMDSAAGRTVSGGTTVPESVTTPSDVNEKDKPVGEKIKDTFLGR
ncbi:cytosolic-abundant heat soluble protein 86272-like isoform X2 [Paramacrobiotus metropolitanus]|uniref:cytosolic-abundant heat soluble protein 86272-like isoform X2 n=1 Tax=Paramacrobiotus metropolitanus TaxID=2943436 RepID=UPI0024459D87|nr:cytosolic-abundant heat soluble protein 86272-like isoform X2 [Paramacrobiotus metropolitanus]